MGYSNILLQTKTVFESVFVSKYCAASCNSSTEIIALAYCFFAKKDTWILNSILRRHYHDYGFRMTACWEKVYSVLGGVANNTEYIFFQLAVIMKP